MPEIYITLYGNFTTIKKKKNSTLQPLPIPLDGSQYQAALYQ